MSEVEDPGIRLLEMKEKVFAASMEADSVLADVGFVINYKKIKGTNKAMTISGCQNYVNSAGEIMSKLLDCSKQLKELLPSKSSSSGS